MAAIFFGTEKVSDTTLLCSACKNAKNVEIQLINSALMNIKRPPDQLLALTDKENDQTTIFLTVLIRIPAPC